MDRTSWKKGRPVQRAAWQPVTWREKMRGAKLECHTWELELGNIGKHGGEMEAKRSHMEKSRDLNLFRPMTKKRN